MKNSRNFLAATLCGVAFLVAPLSSNAQLFSENFENGLSQWTGNSGGSSSAVTVADPLNSGHGMVLALTTITLGGDIFSANPLSFQGSYQVSFDYLGRPGLGGVPGDLGGFMGFSDSLHPVYQYVDHFWFAGTIDGYGGLSTTLIDDGAWHHYSITVPGTFVGPHYLMIEDYDGSGGVAGDALFDNIVVAPVPEPSLSALVLPGLLLGVLRIKNNRAFPRGRKL